MPDFLLKLVLVLVVVGVFNLIIFVHELGHFLAARWRGLQVDRFQIWFGKPIWKKEWNGVQYGLGWLPAGGFVSLPQMAPMEVVEGERIDEAKDLPPVKPLDKIIVAAAGPLFSLLLALAAGAVVWGVGKPRDVIPSTTIGYVQEDSPAEISGLQVGDKILKIDGEEVDVFGGSLDGVMEKIMMSEGEKIGLTVRRGDEILELKTDFRAPSPGGLFKRSGLRTIGISPAGEARVNYIAEKSPGERAGFKEDDVITEIDGMKVTSVSQLANEVNLAEAGKPLKLMVKRGDQILSLAPRPQIPVDAKTGEPVPEAKPILGLGFTGGLNEEIYYPTPFQQVADSAEMMWVTIKKVAAPGSDVGIQHLSGPVGIGNVMWVIMQTENGWKRLLFFIVLFNVNLAILNMLPFPVLDGGHILLSFMEMVAGRPVQARLLGAVQTVFALLLFSLFLFITSKDVGGLFGNKRPEITFPEPIEQQ